MAIVVTIKNKDVEEFRELLGNNPAEVTRDFKTFQCTQFRVGNNKFFEKLLAQFAVGHIFAGHILSRPVILFASNGTKVYQVPSLDYCMPACSMQSDGTFVHEAEARAYLKARKTASDYLGV